MGDIVGKLIGGVSHAVTIGQSFIWGLWTFGKPWKSGVHVGFGGIKWCLFLSSIWWML